MMEISDKLNLNKTTVYRLLKTLEDNGFIAQDITTRKYYLGTDIINLASNPIVANGKLIFCAQPEMVKLCSLSGETVILEILFGTHRMYLEAIESTEPIRYRQTAGYFAPLYAGAGGKAILSQFTQENLEKYIRNVKFTPAGPKALLDKHLLLEEIEKVRDQGYAISSGERYSYGSSISAPIRNYEVPAALSIVGPGERWKPRMMDILEELKASTSRISYRLLEK